MLSSVLNNIGKNLLGKILDKELLEQEIGKILGMQLAKYLE